MAVVTLRMSQFVLGQRRNEYSFGLQDISSHLLCSLLCWVWLGTRCGVVMRLGFVFWSIGPFPRSLAKGNDPTRVRKLNPKPELNLTPNLFARIHWISTRKMSKRPAIPDAWDDDWESQADKADQTAAVAKVEEQQVKISKAERLAKHAETNKKIWDSA